MTADDETDADEIRESARRRQHARAESVESMPEGTDGFFDEDKYPATGERSKSSTAWRGGPGTGGRRRPVGVAVRRR